MFNNVQEFVAALNDAFKKLNNENYSFEIESGRKYDKVISVNYGSRSCYCFVDRAGNVYKTASWAAPAKGVRATLANLTVAHCDAVAASGYATTGWLYK